MGIRDQYNAYVLSSAWRKRRDAFALSRRWTCEVCGHRDWSIQVHHLTYERLGAELDEDLQVLCRPCHVAAHHPPVIYDDWPTLEDYERSGLTPPPGFTARTHAESTGSS